MTQLEPKDLRNKIVDGLYRSLVGPSDALGIDWLGKPVATIDPTVAGFKVEGFPVGPWADGKSREIVHQDPLRLYSVGVVFPILPDLEREVLQADEEIDEDPDVDVPVNSEITENSVASDSDESVDSASTDFNFQGPRSISFSVRLTGNQQEFNIRLRCGLYSKVPIGTSTDSWWVRDEIDVQVSRSINATPEQQTFQIRTGFELKIGLEERQDAEGSKLLTVWLRNDTKVPDNRSAAEFAVFQTKLSCTFDELSPIRENYSQSPASLDLLYRDIELRAIGHGCAVKVVDHENGIEVITDVMPVAELDPLTPDIEDEMGDSYSVGMIDLSEFNPAAVAGIEKLFDGYRKWITDKESQVQGVSIEYQKIASEHVFACTQFLNDAEEGWKLCGSKPDIKKCLTNASLAMNQQREAYGSDLREIREEKNSLGYSVDPRLQSGGAQARWRPFQIAFILASIKKIVDLEFRKTDGRGVDVIWMPTGGGKTEAYLGLAAFTILWQRLIDTRLQGEAGRSIPNMKVLMRYTYRLLTVQQVARASSLICALELIRSNEPNQFGTDELTIGAWLGAGVTANDRKYAIKQLEGLIKGLDVNKFLLKKCPWCGCQIGKVISEKVLGYKVVETDRGAQRVMAYCPDPTCEFHERQVIGVGGVPISRGLPIYEIDEDIYSRPPDFLIATIDKFARLAWKPEAHRLFGLKNGKRVANPPQLLIQDELHLISGPLGSIDGVFEIAVEELCKQLEGISPVYVASTATTKNYEDQISKLYDRSGRLIPPPGLTIEDSFFAKRDRSRVGKTYVAVCATGSFSGVDVQTNVLAALSYGAAVLGPTRENLNVDPWWTNVVFFSSRRALGLLSSLIDTSLHKRMSRLRALSGRRSGTLTTEKDQADRYNHKVSELTATSSEDVNEVFDGLERKIPDPQTIDLCFATSMVEVGLDVSRLGLMTVIGQPKSSSQYIQATGRVGRNDSGPGLVVSVLKPTNARDLSHYEGFHFWHERLYASVESASVTPFTTRALERSLPSFMAILLRAKSPGPKIADAVEHWDSVAQVLLDRISDNKKLQSNAQVVLANLKSKFTAPDAKDFVWDKWIGDGEPLMYSAESIIPLERRSSPMWLVLNSMRSVEADAMMKLTLPDVRKPTKIQDEPTTPDEVDNGEIF